MRESLPADIETIFLDAGNTLISMDFRLIAAEFASCGFDAAVNDLARAEAAARPAASAFLAGLTDQSGLDAFVFYLAQILERLPGTAGLAPDTQDRLVRAVAARLKRPGGDHQLWSVVLDGVPAALASLRAAGLRLVVVSNSDGSVERALNELDLAAHLDLILDSAVVGFEKPDPRFFRHALAAAAAAAETTLHVGDMYFQDVLGARSAGIESVLLDPHGDWAGVDCLRRQSLADVAAELTGGV